MTGGKPLFLECDRRLREDDAPSGFLRRLFDRGPAGHPFALLERLRHTEQSPEHHPEGNVWNHTLLVVDEAAKRKSESRDARVFLWAALLHDIGKPDTTRLRKGRVTSYDHDREGARLAGEFLGAFTEDEGFVNRVTALVRWHMQILFVVNGLPYADIRGMKRETDVREVALLGLCDRLGRLGADPGEEEENIRRFLQRCERT